MVIRIKIDNADPCGITRREAGRPSMEGFLELSADEKANRAIAASLANLEREREADNDADDHARVTEEVTYIVNLIEARRLQDSRQH